MLKLTVSAALLIAAAPVLAQDAPGPAPAPAGPEAAIQTAAMAFGQCVSAGVQALDSGVAPEAGASSVVGGCATQRDQLVQAVEAMIAAMPADQQQGAREQLRTQLGQVETHVAAAIREQRTAAAAPATAQ